MGLEKGTEHRGSCAAKGQKGTNWKVLMSSAVTGRVVYGPEKGCGAQRGHFLQKGEEELEMGWTSSVAIGRVVYGPGKGCGARRGHLLQKGEKGLKRGGLDEQRCDWRRVWI